MQFNVKLLKYSGDNPHILGLKNFASVETLHIVMQPQISHFRFDDKVEAGTSVQDTVFEVRNDLEHTGPANFSLRQVPTASLTIRGNLLGMGHCETSECALFQLNRLPLMVSPFFWELPAGLARLEVVGGGLIVLSRFFFEAVRECEGAIHCDTHEHGDVRG